MHDILPPKGMYDVSRDRFKFREISDNISITVQDKERHGCNGTLIGNRMWPIEWHSCQYPLNNLEGHVCCLKPFELPYLVKRSTNLLTLRVAPSLCSSRAFRKNLFLCLIALGLL